MSALCLLHGFTGHPASFQKVLAQLPLQTRVVCPVLPGHDGSEPSPGAAPDFQSAVDRLADELRAAHLGPLHLCGYSLGARVALGLLVSHPELFAGATLISVHPGLTDPAERRERAAADERWAALLQDQGLAEFLQQWARQPLFATQAALPAAVLAAQDAVRRRHSATGLALALRVLGLAQMPDYAAALPALRLPVRLVVGAHDPKFLALAERVAARLPQAAVVRVPSVGHNVLLEAPDAVCALLGAPPPPAPAALPPRFT